jgi:hypothetical protein
LKVAPEKIGYAACPLFEASYTDRMDREYTWQARVNDALITLFSR